jgi:hypothetical protein
MVANTSDGGLAVLFYGPSRADLDVPEAGRVTLRQETGYPFDDEVRLSVRAEAASWRFPLRLRIPGWSRSASVVAPPDVRVRREGAELVLEAAWREHEVVLSFDPSIRHLAAVDGQVAVARGPLVYALPIAHEERVVGEHALPGFADRQFTPVAEARWDVALQVDRDDPARAFELVRTDGGFPWEAPPLALRTTVLDATWTRTTVAPNAEEVVLVPYGSTVLRRTCFPAVDRTGRPLLPVAVMKPDA